MRGAEAERCLRAELGLGEGAAAASRGLHRLRLRGQPLPAQGQPRVFAAPLRSYSRLWQPRGLVKEPGGQRA